MAAVPDLDDLRKRLDEARGYLHESQLRSRLADLDTELADPELWNDPERGRNVTTEHGQVRSDLDMLDGMAQRLDDAEMLDSLGREEDDPATIAEGEQMRATVARDLDTLELRSLFVDDFEANDAIVTIAAKDGGTDAQDWAQMLVRMYSRWAERRGFTVEINDVTEGQEAGILSATFTMKGRYATGFLIAERGIHRLVRISPFDGNARRQTSFAAVNVVPVLEDLGAIEIDEKDLRIDTYRSSGAGGQHVNKTSSAIRLTHIPTGLVTQCQNERSQLQNKNNAMQQLASLLAQKARDERDEEVSSIQGKKALIGWGSQIRSYVLAPYQMVKDLRTEHETSQVQAVLDGDLDEFIESYLRWRRANANTTADQ
jgi:peptide chain release factor 2